MFKNKVTAYIDEFGAFGFNFEKSGCSSHFILSAIIVNEEDKDNLISESESIRHKYFQSGEMKSSTIGSRHHVRRSLINVAQAQSAPPTPSPMPTPTLPHYSSTLK